MRPNILRILAASMIAVSASIENARKSSNKLITVAKQNSNKKSKQIKCKPKNSNFSKKLIAKPNSVKKNFNHRRM